MSFIMRAEAAAFISKKYLCYGIPDRTLWLDIEINIRDTRNSVRPFVGVSETISKQKED